MKKYIITGGNVIDGKIEAECAKNAVLLFLAASVMTDENVIIEKCPDIADVNIMRKLLENVGAQVKKEDGNLIIDPSSVGSYIADKELSEKLRASVFLLGAFLSRFKKAVIPFPGGCKIGKRPVDLHISAFEKLGIKFDFYKSVGKNGECKEYIEAKADEITGGEIKLGFPSVGATENIMLLTAVSSGTTVIKNAAREPEIVDLQNFLNVLGAKISGAGSKEMVIEGVKKLHGGKYKAIGDRIEGGTFLLAAAITGGKIELKGVDPKNLPVFLNKLSSNTCKITYGNDIIFLKSEGKRKAFSFTTGPFPEFPTDLQAQTAVLDSVSDGESFVKETVFESRFSYINELKKAGARIEISENVAFIKGVKRLHAAEFTAPDLRSGAALVLAGLNAEGETAVSGIEYIKRGYSHFDEKLRSLGADITENET